MSRRARNRRDKRAEADALNDGDEPIDTFDGEPISLMSGVGLDPRTPWPMPGRIHQPTDDERTIT